MYKFLKKHIKTFLIHYIYYSLYIPSTNIFCLQNNAIHSTIHKNISKKLKPFLKEGQLYALSNFEVSTCNKFCRPIQNEHKIIFLPTTNIQELIETKVNIPHHKFEFVDYNTIVQRLNSHVQLLGTKLIEYKFCILLLLENLT